MTEGCCDICETPTANLRFYNRANCYLCWYCCINLEGDDYEENEDDREHPRHV